MNPVNTTSVPPSATGVVRVASLDGVVAHPGAVEYCGTDGGGAERLTCAGGGSLPEGPSCASDKPFVIVTPASSCIGTVTINGPLPEASTHGPCHCMPLLNRFPLTVTEARY